MSTHFINLLNKNKDANKNKDFLEEYLSYLKRFLFKTKPGEDLPEDLKGASSTFFEKGCGFLKGKQWLELLKLILGQVEHGTLFKKRNKELISSLLYILSGLCQRVQGAEKQ